MTLEQQLEKIKSGKMYNDLTEELIQARADAVALTNQYNQSYGQPPQEREKILRQLLGAMGEDVFFEPFFAVSLAGISKLGIISMPILTA